MKCLVKIFLYILFICLTCNCTDKKTTSSEDLEIVFSKNKNGLDLILLNNEVVCVENIDLTINTINEKNYLDDKIYDSLSRNVLNYKLINNSDKKYFIVLNSNCLDVMENNTISQKIIKNRVGTIDGLSFNLYKNDSIIDGRTTLTTGGYMTQLEYYKSSAYKQHLLDSIFIQNAKDMKLYKETNPSILNREVLQNGFIIYPRETKYFSSIVNLPLRKNGVNWISDINKSKPNLASFSLVNIAENTKKYMSENQKKELEENGYSLFNGVLQSNKVPVKMVSMPK